MAHPVADMLLISHKAALAAMRSGNEEELANALQLAYRVLTHRGAANFFQALAAAVEESPDQEDDELFGNDPTVLDEPDPEEIDDLEPKVDEDSDASNPADEGLVNHDESAKVRIKVSTIENASALPWLGEIKPAVREKRVIDAVVRNFGKFA